MKRLIPWSFWLFLTVLGLTACAGSYRQAPEPNDPLQAPSPSLDTGLFRFYELNLGETIDALALSGGGQNGAYGVGLIQGWREIGIPHFDVVTGVSTGSLIASHIFLGSAEADQVMEHFYTTVKKSDILCERNIIANLTSDSLATMVPLERLLEDVISDDVIDRVAAATEGGKRLLLIGTVNLDTGGYRIWDMGAMARARMYAKYRAVLRASSGPPVAVPPVYLDGGMHCDGGTASSVFIPFGKHVLTEGEQARLYKLADRRGVPVPTPGTLYVVVNGLQEPATKRMKPSLLDIAGRALDVQGYSMRLGNLWYIYHQVDKAGGQFRLRFLPQSLKEEAKDFLGFDPKNMRKIFDQGLQDGRNPRIWETSPPILRADR